MFRILFILAVAIASVAAEGNVPSVQPLKGENSKYSNVTSPTHRGPPFTLSHLPPVNTLQKFPVLMPHPFYSSLQSPVELRGQAFPVSQTPNVNTNFSRVQQGTLPTNGVHFIPSAVTSAALAPGVALLPGNKIPLTSVVPSSQQDGTNKKSEALAEETFRPTLLTSTKEKTLLKQFPNGVVDTRLPVGTKPGVCPVRQCTTQHIYQQVRMCHSDANCLATEKCCQDPCWGILTCAVVATVPEPNALVCPPQTPCTDRTYKVVCRSDLECYPSVGSKCCMDQCLAMTVCKHPVLSNAAVNPSPWLPPIVPPVQPPSTSNKCKRYCPGTLECCDSVLNVGFCPASSLCYTPAQAAALSHNFKSCTVDLQCSESEKCCLSRCHNRLVCLPSVSEPEVHPGSCPAATSGCVPSEERNLAQCTNDRQCYLFQKCCKSSCNPNLSLCKDTTERQPSTNTSTPQCTTYCPGGKFCCDGETKPGYCPTTRLCPGLTIPSPVCTSDYNCLGDKKCCLNSCSGFNECSSPVTAPNSHAGFCPVPNCSAAVPPVAAINQCVADTDCYLHQKCCRDCSQNKKCETSLSAPRCRFLCSDQKTCCDGKEKPGYCPAKAVCGSGPSGSFEVCSEDYQCSGSSKCCYDDCVRRKVCQKSVSNAGEHPGVCPTTPCDAPGAKFICHYDSDCYFHERCCPAANRKNECQATNCTQPFAPYNVLPRNAAPVPQSHLSPNLNLPQYPVPPSTIVGNPSSNKSPSLSAPAHNLAPGEPSFGSMTSPGGQQSSHPLPPRRSPPGSTNYPGASQPISNRYTSPNDQRNQPQISLPQISNSFLPSSGRSGAPRFKQRPNYYRPAYPTYNIPNA